VNGSYLASGPVVWLITIVITTLLLVAATKALWLVVPLLIAIILYYMLFPIVRRLTLSGIAREPAAAIVAGVGAGAEDIFPDRMSAGLYDAWKKDHKAVERQFATM